MEDHIVQKADPEDVFTALADDTRLKILQALWEMDAESATFSELRDVVGMRDSGQFNYHLDSLTGQFITKTDGEYQLTQAGKQVNGAILSGVYTEEAGLDPIELDSSCRACGGDQTLQYEDEVVQIECESCLVGWSIPVPPAVLAGYTRDEIPQVVSRYFQTRFHRIINGFCSYCYGQMQSRVGPITSLDVGSDPSEQEAEQLSDFPVVQFDCGRCGATAGIGLDDALLLTHPVVDQFYYEHGIDVRDCLIWDGTLELGDPEIECREPVRARVVFRAEGAELMITVDETFSVIDIER